MSITSNHTVSNSSYTSNLSDKPSSNQDNLERLVSVFAEKLRIAISHSPDGGVDYSHDIEAQNLIHKIYHLAPQILEDRVFSSRGDFIFSKEEAHTLLTTCSGVTGIDYTQFDPGSTNATDLFAQVRSDSLQKTAKKRVKDNKPPSNTELNLGYHPTLEILKVIQNVDDQKSSTINTRIEGNNEHLSKSSDLVKFAARLRKDNKESKGVDYSDDEAMKKEMHRLHDHYPHIFGSVQKDPSGKFASYKFSHEEIEAMKTSSGEQTQILMGRQNVNKGHIENDMQEKNHLWELGHAIHREHSSLMDKINSKTARGG